jgi:predicted GTPase
LHARKVTEVREWLHSNLVLLQQHQQRQQQQQQPRSHTHLPTAQRLLVLTGPAGCGKSSLIRALCASPSLGCVDNGHVNASGGGNAAGESELRIITWHDVPELEYSATRRAGMIGSA